MTPFRNQSKITFRPLYPSLNATAALEEGLSEIEIHGNRTDEDIAKLRDLD